MKINNQGKCKNVGKSTKFLAEQVTHTNPTQKSNAFGMNYFTRLATFNLGYPDDKQGTYMSISSCIRGETAAHNASAFASKTLLIKLPPAKLPATPLV